jgi:linoleoyl-CoA desaturase
VDATKVGFPRRAAAALLRDIKAGVAAYFETRRRSSKGNRAMWLKTLLLFGVVVGSYAAIMSNRFTPLAMLGLAVVLGIGIAGVGFSVAHDALLGAYSGRPAVNHLNPERIVPLRPALGRRGANGRRPNAGKTDKN